MNRFLTYLIIDFSEKYIINILIVKVLEGGVPQEMLADVLALEGHKILKDDMRLILANILDI